MLLDGEREQVARAVRSRQLEYATVRACARTCLGRLGHPPVPIPPGSGGAPTWPPGFRGSMTHCTGDAGAAVGPARRFSAIGIDAEPDAPLPDGVLAVVATPTEQERLGRTPRRPGDPSWDRLLFSAKEAVYKAWFPVVGTWLDAQETEIRFAPEGATFTAELPRDGLVVDARRVTRLHGRWTRSRGVLLTAVVVPAPIVGDEEWTTV
jgi:4'-phosphopantetheinyl transferase EntD